MKTLDTRLWSMIDYNNIDSISCAQKPERYINIAEQRQAYNKTENSAF